MRQRSTTFDGRKLMVGEQIKSLGITSTKTRFLLASVQEWKRKHHQPLSLEPTQFVKNLWTFFSPFCPFSFPFALGPTSSNQEEHQTLWSQFTTWILLPNFSFETSIVLLLLLPTRYYFANQQKNEGKKYLTFTVEPSSVQRFFGKRSGGVSETDMRKKANGFQFQVTI
jgi:hypothetical protein